MLGYDALEYFDFIFASMKAFAKYQILTFFGPNVMDKKLLDILACPVCKSSLSYEPDNQELLCSPCKLAYPVKDGIPVMLEDEARMINAGKTSKS